MLLETLHNNLTTYADRTAFVIGEQSFSYAVFKEKVTQIQQRLFQLGLSQNEAVLVHTYDDIETYAAIFAVWFSGGTFVPIDPTHPKERNDLVINQLDVTYCITSNLDTDDSRFTYIDTKTLKQNDKDLVVVQTDIERLLYIIFTSGSTGTPKGVPITLKNLNAYITHNRALFPKIKETSRFLQVYNLTFDASIQSYVLPLYTGASVYTVSPNKIKFLETYRILQKHRINFAKISNTIITYLKPYYSSIVLPDLDYCVFAGEGLDVSTLLEWKKSVPNAELINVYGPTEATVNALYYPIPAKESAIKSYHNIVAIGRAFGTNKTLIIDAKQNEVPIETQGELCLSGRQITSGYWQDRIKNEQQFFMKNAVRYYKTGDIVYKDSEGDLYFVGRQDQQVKIQGYRVELTEIEKTVKSLKVCTNCVALSTTNKQQTNEIVLFTEKLSLNPSKLENTLKNKLPQYMLPARLIDLNQFPLNSNGKIDRQALIKLIH
jgi:amino acid adenylation domain-containing protein